MEQTKRQNNSVTIIYLKLDFFTTIYLVTSLPTSTVQINIIRWNQSIISVHKEVEHSQSMYFNLHLTVGTFFNFNILNKNRNIIIRLITNISNHIIINVSAIITN